MKYIQNRKSKGLSGSVLAAFVAAVLLLAGSSVSAQPGALAENDTMKDQSKYGSDKQETRGLDESAMGESQSSGDNPFGGGPIESTGKVKDYAKFVLNESTEYTVNGLKEFTTAAKSFIQKGEGEEALKQSHKDLEKAVSQISEAKEPRMQAERASQAFKDASQLFSDIQAQNYPQSSQLVAPVRSAADKITGDQSLAMQLGNVQNFFVESGKAFTQLASGGEGIGGGPMEEPAKSIEPSDNMDSEPLTPTDTNKPVQDPAGGGPADGTAPPSGY